MKVFYLDKEYITLAQFLKFNSYINSGGEAKYFLEDYVVLVNGERCTLRGKKLYNNDLVTVDNDDYILKHDQKN